ncbi:von Willebrand factor D and EGF domain-containing protein [Elysia marginata]|uniref:von Willebrand factor D and EGF domain-containing protein n=1 Tax=Elysia marginata TaxID=1093978 RepID=A0AAV4JR29_9GAST|nr:von Willebrand factor D and EGF domain-containing protein [Elysia marginata]
MGDTEWATSHLEDLTEQCVESAQREEAAWNNTDTEQERDGEPDLPVEISSGLCELDCGQDQNRGSCVSGFCECNTGFTGESCEVTEATRPDVLPATDTCDLVTSSCTDVAIEGDNFVPSLKLKCTFKFAKMDSNLTLTTEEATAPAEFVDMSHVVCPLPQAAIAKRQSAFVTVSNDGITESEQIFLHVVHKSSCQECQLLNGGKDARCTFKTDACIIDGECYAALERYVEDKCYRCDPQLSQSSWTKTSEPRCKVDSGSQKGETDQAPETSKTASDKSGSDNDTLVIVLGILCGVLAVATLGAFVIICRKLSTQKKEPLLPASEKRFNISGKGVTAPESTTADILIGSAAAVRLSEAYKE